MALNDLIRTKAEAQLKAKMLKIIKRDLALLEDITRKYYSRGVLGGATPAVYARTGALEGSIYKTSIEDHGDKLVGYVKFNASAWHDSYIGGKAGYTPILVSEGWAWRNPAKQIPYFTSFKGTHALANIEREFNAKKSKYTNFEIIGR